MGCSSRGMRAQEPACELRSRKPRVHEKCHCVSVAQCTSYCQPCAPRWRSAWYLSSAAQRWSIIASHLNSSAAASECCWAARSSSSGTHASKSFAEPVRARKRLHTSIVQLARRARAIAAQASAARESARTTISVKRPNGETSSNVRGSMQGQYTVVTRTPWQLTLAQQVSTQTPHLRF